MSLSGILFIQEALPESQTVQIEVDGHPVYIQRIEAILLITPFIILLGTLTGTVNGAISGLLIKNLKKSE
ncbi:MAG: hypothetical protein Q8P40_05575 [Nitrospirota bacterium]|nr:hypothetical protein [Nitrospirota bacterium]